MGSEILLYGYGLVCLGMLVFNICYIAVTRRDEQRLERRSGRMVELVSAQIARIRAGEAVEHRHIRYLQRKLSHIGGLIAFDSVLEEEFFAPNDQAVKRYQEQIQPVILNLAVTYARREDMQAAYFAYFLSKYGKAAPFVREILVEYMRKSSLYCRVNALEALYSFGCAESVAEAIRVLDEENSFLHEKILTDGLLSFAGDHTRLIDLLWREFDALSERTQLAVLNYIRFRTGDCCERMLAILTDERRNKELRLSAIRYFGRYVYPPALPYLLTFAADGNHLNWEYAAVSASALAKYPGEEPAAVLMDAMHSSDWYIRANAAASLESFQVDYRDLIRVVGGRDRYAREMLMYQLEHRRMTEKREAVPL